MSALPGETELKLWLLPEDAAAFMELPRLRRARLAQQRLHTIYFDTPDFALARRGVAMRVRKQGRRWVQTLKTEGEKAGGLSKRLELESAVSGPAPDLARLPAEAVGALIEKKWRAALVPVYETRFRRSTRNLRAPDGSRVEVALDQGEILAGKRSQPLCEVELELKSGSADALYALAQTFASRVLLLPFDLSKAERGARLAAGAKPAPVAATRPALAAMMPLCAAFARIMGAGLAQLQANLPGLLQETDPEYLHQARVAVRRMRSAARLFGRACPLPDEEMGRIAELSRALGEARDWDVFVLETLPALSRGLPAQQKSLLARRAQATRRSARAAMLALVRRPQTGADLLALHRRLNALAGGRGKTGLVGFSAKKLAALHAAVIEGARDFSAQSPEQRHRLRIRVKRLRYALDYLGALFGDHKKFLACFEALQDELGALNDANTAMRFLSDLNRDRRLDGAVAQIARELEAGMQARLDVGARLLREFSRLEPPWQ
ncbi:MAG: CHAD domain-containing protein [Pseudomonadota bacterium]